MIGTQEYVWTQLAERTGLAWPDATGWAMAQAAAARLTAWEPLVREPDDVQRVIDLARRHGLAVPSVFLTGPLHDPARVAVAADRMVSVLHAAAASGCRLVAVYPSPAEEGDAKTDQALRLQAEALGRVAGTATGLGLRLLYHPEEPDFRHAAREVVHMLVATDPGHVGLCLDPDTVWRAAGGSMVAVLDFVRLWGSRVGEVHLRQCQDGIWAEALGPGDLDLGLVAATLRASGAKPFVVVEHAIEPGTPDTLGPIEAHRRSLRYVRDVLALHLDG